MNVSGFLLYRLNLVDRQDLFTQKPVQNDSDLVEIFESAANERFDVTKQGRRSGYKRALRNVLSDSLGSGRSFISAIFSCEISSRRGYIG
jgi:hypothetical protein